MQRIAVLSLHTSPLAQPGVGDAGGMNVYVRELVTALAHAGLDCTTYVRRWRDGLPDVVTVEPNHRVVHSFVHSSVHASVHASVHKVHFEL